jgi:hypothetical protein
MVIALPITIIGANFASEYSNMQAKSTKEAEERRQKIKMLQLRKYEDVFSVTTLVFSGFTHVFFVSASKHVLYVSLMNERSPDDSCFF